MGNAHPLDTALSCVRYRTERVVSTRSNLGRAGARTRAIGVHITGLTLLALVLIGCSEVRLIATPSAPATPSPTSPAASAGRVFTDPACVEYDDYQSAAMAFYSLSAIVQDGLDSAAAASEEHRAETLDSAVARFEATVRLALAGDTIADPDPIEELALFWVASDGCMR